MIKYLGPSEKQTIGRNWIFPAKFQIDRNLTEQKDSVRSSFCLDSGESIFIYFFLFVLSSQREPKKQWKRIVIKAEKWTQNVEKKDTRMNNKLIVVLQYVFNFKNGALPSFVNFQYDRFMENCTLFCLFFQIKQKPDWLKKENNQNKMFFVLLNWILQIKKMKLKSYLIFLIIYLFLASVCFF